MLHAVTAEVHVWGIPRACIALAHQVHVVVEVALGKRAVVRVVKYCKQLLQPLVQCRCQRVQMLGLVRVRQPLGVHKDVELLVELVQQVGGSVRTWPGCVGVQNVACQRRYLHGVELAVDLLPFEDQVGNGALLRLGGSRKRPELLVQHVDLLAHVRVDLGPSCDVLVVVHGQIETDATRLACQQAHKLVVLGVVPRRLQRQLQFAYEAIVHVLGDEVLHLRFQAVSLKPIADGVGHLA